MNEKISNLMILKLEKRLNKIEYKIDKLTELCNKIDSKIDDNLSDNCNKMTNHIDFIESIYIQLKNPIEYITTKITGKKKALPSK